MVLLRSRGFKKNLQQVKMKFSKSILSVRHHCVTLPIRSEPLFGNFRITDECRVTLNWPLARMRKWGGGFENKSNHIHKRRVLNPRGNSRICGNPFSRWPAKYTISILTIGWKRCQLTAVVKIRNMVKSVNWSIFYCACKKTSQSQSQTQSQQQQQLIW